MIKKDSFVIYKNTFALVKEIEGDKFTVEWLVQPASPGGKKAQFAQQKVREKDVVVFMNSDFNAILTDEKANLEKSAENAENTSIRKNFSEKIEKAAKESGGTLKLMKEARQIEDGFILVYGGIEENCTFRALLDAKKDQLQDQVNRILFM